MDDAIELAGVDAPANFDDLVLMFDLVHDELVRPAGIRRQRLAERYLFRMVELPLDPLPDALLEMLRAA